MVSILTPSAAWGEGLFENENDFDVVRYLNQEMGINELELAAKAAGAATSQDGTQKGGEVIRYSVHARSCSNEAAVEAVKKHLDAGALKKMCAKMVERYFNPMKTSEYTSKGYLPVILGACAMTLGCKLDGIPGYRVYFATYRSFLGGIYETALLMDQAKEQVWEALKGKEHAYTDGKAYDFGGRTLAEAMAARAAAGATKPMNKEKFAGNGQGMTGGLPVGYKSSRGTGKTPLMGLVMNSIGPCSPGEVHGGGHGGCEACGREVASGKILLQCGRCKDIKYCSKNCQRDDWNRHRVCCRTPEDAKAMREDPRKWTNLFYFDPRDQMGNVGGLAAMMGGASMFSG